jgi:hypothetical protein
MADALSEVLLAFSSFSAKPSPGSTRVLGRSAISSWQRQDVVVVDC